MQGKSFLLFFAGRMHLARGVSSSKSFQTARETRLLALSQIFSRSLLTLDLVYHQTKTLRTPHARVCQYRSTRTLADADHACIRKLAPCLRHHLSGDGWFEFVRRIHRRIVENPWIPLRKNGLSNISPSVSPMKRRSSAGSFPDLRYSSLHLLTVAHHERGWNLIPRALTFAWFTEKTVLSEYLKI